MTKYTIISIVLGLVLIFVCLIIVILNPDLNPQGFWIIRILVSLGAGFVAAGILGNLEISGSVANITIKAGGSLAVTVLVYLLNPPQIVLALIN
jgi:hypothetical protein